MKLDVETIRGPVPIADLGRTYMHEHIFVLTPDVQQNYPEDWGDDATRIEAAAAQLRALAAQGIRTIVDLTVVGTGRNIPLVQRVAAKVPELNIIVATGIYTYDAVPLYFKFRRAPTGGLDPMTEMFVRDIRDGIQGTGVKAGMLKCAIDKKGLTAGVERIMRAVARAHHLTDVPITVHTDAKSRTGLIVKRILCDEEGVRPDRIVLAHCGETTDCDHLQELAEFGFVLGMDRFGIYAGLSPQERADTVIELCRRGHARKMILSHDAACYIDWLDEAALRSLPDWHYRHIAEAVIPRLTEGGVTEAQIAEMLVEVPRTFFSQSG